MGYQFGQSSQSKLDTCDERLQRVCQRAIAYGVMDFSVIEGQRTIEAQQRAYREGRTQIDGVTRKGKHNHYPSLAVDLLPYPSEINGINVWSDKQRFCMLAGVIHAAAAEEGVEIIWGGDWDGDGNNADSNFHDLPHFELV